MDRPAHILLVDDNAEGCAVVGEVLTVVGYDVTTSATGRRALALMDMQRFDAVVVDLSLPDIDAMEVLRAIRGQADGPLAVVFSRFERPRAAAEDIGCDAFILKPQIEQLLVRLETLLAERRAPAAGEPKVKQRV